MQRLIEAPLRVRRTSDLTEQICHAISRVGEKPSSVEDLQHALGLLEKAIEHLSQGTHCNHDRLEVFLERLEAKAKRQADFSTTNSIC
jgi:hypothetical protein